MSKGSGGTRAGSSGSPRGLSGASGASSRSLNGWQMTTDSYGFPAVKKSGSDANELYRALSSPVEQAVQERVGSIRSGGGYSGPRESAEFTIIFRNGTTTSQIREYMGYMKEGAKLYAAVNDAENRLDYNRARRAFDAWYKKMRNGS